MITSKEGHTFQTRDEVVEAILNHSGNYHPETLKPAYTQDQLFSLTDAELIAWLGSCFSAEFTGFLESVTTVIHRKYSGGAK